MQEELSGVIDHVLISEQEIADRIQTLAQEIARDYADCEHAPVMLSVLSGSFVFASDLMRAMQIPVAISFMYASSYSDSSVSSGTVNIQSAAAFDPKDQDILILEDIIDTGRTLDKVRKELLARGARSVEICAFLNKPSRRVVDVPVRYTGFEIPDEFVVGYGLDYGYRYRQFPFVGVLKKEIYTK